MKKIIISLLLGVSLLACAGVSALAEDGSSVSALAENESGVSALAEDGSGSGSTAVKGDDENNLPPESFDVKGTFNAAAAAGETYYVDVTWQNMSFTYTEASQGKWDPDTMQYTGATPASWSNSTDGGYGTITVTNKSAIDTSHLDVTLSFTRNGTEGSLAMFFSENRDEVKDTKKAKRDTINLEGLKPTTLEGSPGDSRTVYAAPASKNITAEAFAGGKIGFITITVKAETWDNDPGGMDEPEIG